MTGKVRFLSGTFKRMRRRVRDNPAQVEPSAREG